MTGTATPAAGPVEAILNACREYGPDDPLTRVVIEMHTRSMQRPVDTEPLGDLPDSLQLDEDAPSGPVCLADVTEAKPLTYQTQGITLSEDVNGIVGGGGAGKTGLLVHVAGATAAGELAFNERQTTSGPVLFVTGEDDRHVIKNRLVAMALGHRWDVDRVLRNFHVWDEGIDLDDPACQFRLIEAGQDLKIILAPFDPLIDLCGAGVEENSNSDAKRVTRFLRKFARATGATPVLSMHTAKAAEGKTREDRVRGASAWRNATRLCWWVEPCDGGLELDPIKANRTGRPKVLRVRQTIATEPDNELMWKAAHYALDVSGDVVHANVLKILRYVAGCAVPPGVRDVQDATAEHGVNRDHAREALAIAKGRGWLTADPGPRRSLLHTVTEPGQARLMLG